MECRLDKMTVNYEVYGAGRPLIMLPGWGIDARSHAHYMEQFLRDREGWQRYYIDPPGHGRSPGTDWVTSLDQMLDVLLACLDQIIPGQSFALSGVSLGAYLARGVLYHRSQAIDGLLMMIPGIIPEDARRDTPEPVVLVEDPQVMAALNDEERELIGMAVVRNQAVLDWMRAWPQLPEEAQSDYAFLQQIREDPDRYRCSFDVDALEQPFAKPTLIVTGRQDAVVGYADAYRLLDTYPRATFVVLDRAGHFLEEKEAIIQPLIAEWLDRVEESLAG
jgi:pimeloyl-ACP methyl ester carboxylesterase